MPLLPTDPKKQRLLFLGLAPLVVAAGYWYFVQQKQTAKVKADQSRLEQLQTRNEAARALAAQGGPELKKKVELYQEHVVRLEQLIPKSEEVPDLLHDITMRADQSGVELNLMRPEKPVSVDFYTRQTYSMSVVGPYDSVARFLTAVGSLSRIVTPRRLKLIPRTDYSRSGALNLQAEFQIQTFVAPEPAESTPDTARSKPKNVHT